MELHEDSEAKGTPQLFSFMVNKTSIIYFKFGCTGLDPELLGKGNGSEDEGKNKGGGKVKLEIGRVQKALFNAKGK